VPEVFWHQSKLVSCQSLAVVLPETLMSRFPEKMNPPANFQRRPRAGLVYGRQSKWASIQQLPFAPDVVLWNSDSFSSRSAVDVTDANVAGGSRCWLPAAAHNLSVLMRVLFKMGTPRGLQQFANDPAGVVSPLHLPCLIMSAITTAWSRVRGMLCSPHPNFGRRPLVATGT
jgi:hypothetical protein